ncbi:MAG: FRG domain-containing protein [Isosphaeraceae bacterium]
MAWPVVPITSWEGFLRSTERLSLVKPYGYPAYVFRGQSNAEWDNLQPSLARVLKGRTSKEAMELEKMALREFKRQAHPHVDLKTFDSRDDPMEWWPWMQHYRAPTRLLDWTASPFVALYFAVSGNRDKDGVVWLFHPSGLNHEMESRYPDAKPNPVTPSGWSHHWPETAFFEPKSPACLYWFHSLFPDQRMVAQQGSFTICFQPLADHADVIGSATPIPGKIQHQKLLIPRKLKGEFLLRLHNMNIAAHSLYPGIEGTGMYVEELLRLSQEEPPRDPYEMLATAEDAGVPVVAEFRYTSNLGNDVIVCDHQQEFEATSRIEVRFTREPADRLCEDSVNDES